MPWFRVDDALHSHPKTRRAGLAAMGLWTLAGSYSMGYKTNGHVPTWWVRQQPGGVRLAAQLVAAGLWEPVDTPGPGWLFHDWLHHQESADQIEAKRERGRERTRKWREAMTKKAPPPPGDGVSDGVGDASRDAHVTVPSTYTSTSTFTHGSSRETSAAASPKETRASGGGGDNPEWNRVVDRLAALGVKPGGWSDRDDAEARDLCARFGWVALVDEAMSGKPPNVLRGCLSRWRRMQAPRPAVVSECPEHGPHSTRVCIECHTEAIRAKKESA